MTVCTTPCVFGCDLMSHKPQDFAERDLAPKVLRNKEDKNPACVNSAPTTCTDIDAEKLTSARSDEMPKWQLSKENESARESVRQGLPCRPAYF